MAAMLGMAAIVLKWIQGAEIRLDRAAGLEAEAAGKLPVTRLRCRCADLAK